MIHLRSILLVLALLGARPAFAATLPGVQFDGTTLRLRPTSLLASNLTGAGGVTMHPQTNGTMVISNSASGGGGAATNANQFGATANGQLTLKSGVLTTNQEIYGTFRLPSLTPERLLATGPDDGDVIATSIQYDVAQVVLNNPNVTTNILGAGTVTVTSNNLGGWTITGSGVGSNYVVLSASHLNVSNTFNVYAAAEVVPNDFSLLTRSGQSGLLFDDNLADVSPINTDVTLGENHLFYTIRGRTLYSDNSIRLAGLTASRPAYINAQGTVTNASGTPDGTKFLRDDGVLAVPSGGGSTQMVVAAIGTLGVTNAITVGTDASPGLLTLIGTNVFGAPTNTGIIITNSDPALVGVQKASPVIQQWGQGWKTTATAASQPIGVQFQMEPVQGTTTPTANWIVRFATNSTTFDANPALTLSSSAKTLTLGGNLILPTSSSISVPSGTLVIGSATDVLRFGSTTYMGTSGGNVTLTSAGGLANQNLQVSNYLAQSIVMSGGNPTTAKATRRAGGSSTNAGLGGIIYVGASPIASAGASETNLHAVTLGAHTLTNNGDSLQFTFSGRFAASATTKQIKVVLGSETIYDSTGVLLNNGAWVISGEIIRTGSTAQICNASYSGLGIAAVTAAASTVTAQTNGIATVLKLCSTATDNGAVTNNSFTVSWQPAP